MKSLTKLNKIAYAIMERKFKELLINGNFPEVEYKRIEGYSVSYNMIEYSTKWAQFTKAVHTKLKDKFEFGIWQNARNLRYSDEVTKITESLTLDDINSSDRFQTMFG